MGILSMAGKRVETPVTLTNDVSKLLKCFREIKVSGDSDFITACNIAMLVLKHRQNKNQKQRILLFVASPITHKNDDIVMLGKKLRKNNVAIDVISLGNIDTNREAVNLLVSTANNSNNSHLMEVETHQYIVDCLFGSPILNEDMFEDQGQGQNIPVNQGNIPQNNVGGNVNVQQGGGLSQFERDINLAIQQSMEEEERRRAGQPAENNENPNNNLEKNPVVEDVEEEDEEDIAAELEKARLLSIKEHEDNLRKEKEKEKQMKDDLMKNDDFMRDLLEEVGLEGELNDVMKEVNPNNNEKDGLLDKSKPNKKEKKEGDKEDDEENEKFIKK